MDFDSSLNTLDEGQVRSVRDAFGLNYSVEDIASWNWWNEQPEHIHNFVWGEPCFLSEQWTLDLAPQRDSRTVIESLQAAGHEFVLVSDRAPEMKDWLEAWLRRWGFKDIPVYVTNRVDNPKWSLALELELDYAIEDAPHNVGDFLEKGACPKGIYLIDKPWNRGVNDKNVVRVQNWMQIYERQLDEDFFFQALPKLTEYIFDFVRDDMTIQKIDGKTFIRPISNQERDDNYIVSLKETAHELADTMYKDIQYQVTKHGVQRLDLANWFLVIGEEEGEAIQALNQKRWTEAKREIKQAIACWARLYYEIERVENGLAEEEASLYVKAQ